jgi:DNA-binding beta-propeller fold protein YncE
MEIIPIQELDLSSNVMPIPSSIRNNSGRPEFQFYATDAFTVRMIDGCTGSQQILGGRLGFPACVDGPAGTSRFDAPKGLALSADEKTLYVCDHTNQRIRAIDTTSHIARTVAGSGQNETVDGIGTAASIEFPYHCDWDRASGVEAFTSLYITAYCTVRRLNVKTGRMTTVEGSVDIDPIGIVCLSDSGIIVVTCAKTHCLWTIDPRTNTTLRMAGILNQIQVSPIECCDPLRFLFDGPRGIAWNEHDQSILVADRGADAVYHVPLPDRVFLKPEQVTTSQ